MKTKLHSVFIALALLAGVHQTFAQGTAFTYQGQLQNNGSAANGTYNLTFSLFNTNTSGVPIAEPVTNNAVVITNGLFTVLIDFGSDAFTGQTNWLQIGVESNGISSFTPLTPRQELTPVPYAITAENLNGTLSASQLTSIGGANANFFVGPSGNSTTSGSYNTAIGPDALLDDTSGSYNTANGYSALQGNTTGGGDTADGYDALDNNTSGSFNTASGYGALLENTSGSFNTANGYYALALNTIGSENTANGYIALFDNTSGSENTANGYYALDDNTIGSFNMADGDFALNDSASGSNNIALGYEAGYNISTGSSNIDIGNEGLSTDTNIIRIGSGQCQTFIAGVINGDGSGLTNLNFNNQSNTGTNTTTRLLFPFVSNQTGFDTVIVIANTTADPFGTATTNGTATIYFYGNGAPISNPFTTPTIAAGSTYANTLSALGPGFQGYLIVVCNFPLAHGYGLLTGGSQNYSVMTPALVLPPQRSIVLPESLGQ